MSDEAERIFKEEVRLEEEAFLSEQAGRAEQRALEEELEQQAEDRRRFEEEQERDVSPVRQPDIDYEAHISGIAAVVGQEPEFSELFSEEELGYVSADPRTAPTVFQAVTVGYESINNNNLATTIESGVLPPPFEKVTVLADDAVNARGLLTLSQQDDLLVTYIRYSGFTNYLVENFDQWITVILPTQVAQDNLTFKDGSYVKFSDLRKHSPTFTEGGIPLKLYPQQARKNGLTYGMGLSVIAEHVRVVPAFDENNQPIYHPKYNPDDEDEEPEQVLVEESVNPGEPLIPINLGIIPCMLHSAACNLRGLSAKELISLGEDPEEPKGYFIESGKDRVIILKEMLRLNCFIVTKVKKTGAPLVRITVPTTKGTSLIVLTTRTGTGKTSNKDYVFQSNTIMRKFVYDEITNTLVITRRQHAEPKGEKNKVTKEKIEKYGQINAFMLLQKLLPDYSYDNIADRVLEYVGQGATEQETAQKKRKVKTFLQPSITQATESFDDYVCGRMGVPANTEQYIKELYGWKIIEDDIFPNVEPQHLDPDSSDRKVGMICMMMAQLGELQAGYRGLDDLNRWGIKRLRTPNDMMEQLFRSAWRSMIMSAQEILSDKNKGDKYNKLSQVRDLIIKGNIIESTFHNSFNTSNWGVRGGSMKFNVTQPIKRDNRTAMFSHLTKIDVNTAREGAQSTIRNVQESQWMYVCPAETPESDNCGILKNTAITCLVTRQENDDAVVDYLQSRTSIRGPNTEFQHINPIMVNGIFRGFGNGDLLFAELRLKKIKGEIPRKAALEFNAHGYLQIWTDGNRLTRPLLLMDENQRVTYLSRVGLGASWADIVKSNSVEYVDALEQESYTHIAIDLNRVKARENDINQALALSRNSKERYKDERTEQAKLQRNKDHDAWVELNKRPKFTHCEISPLSLLGIAASLMPWLNRNQAPRITFESGMVKQALGIPHINHEQRVDLGKYKSLAFPQRPMVETIMDDIIGLTKYPQGSDVVVAFMPFYGYNQEDAFVWNRASIERGLFNYWKYIDLSYTIKNTEDTTDELQHPDKYIGKTERPERYHAVGSNGLPYINAFIKRDDAWLGKITTNNHTGKKSNSSQYLKYGEEGVIKLVHVCKTTGGHLLINVKIAMFRVPIEGDKLAPRNAQKATIGLIVDEEDMPRLENGTVIDVLVNPHCMPSRMTYSYVMEMFGAVAAALRGERVDATAFKDFDESKFRDTMREYGFDDVGLHRVHLGTTGNLLEVPIFVGISYFQMLKHHVFDKLQYRGKGPRKQATGQATKGRGQLGGIRFGEMEKDALVVHGVSRNLQERLSFLSDAFDAAYCSKCGIIATVDASAGRYVCQLCHGTAIGKIRIPRSAKHLDQILSALGIVSTFSFESSDDTSSGILEVDFELGEEEIEAEEAEDENDEDERSEY